MAVSSKDVTTFFTDLKKLRARYCENIFGTYFNIYSIRNKLDKPRASVVYVFDISCVSETNWMILFQMHGFFTRKRLRNLTFWTWHPIVEVLITIYKFSNLGSDSRSNYKNILSITDLILTTNKNLFQNIYSFETQMSEFHQLIFIFKTSNKKPPPKQFKYGSFKTCFMPSLKQNFETNSIFSQQGYIGPLQVIITNLFF